MNIDLTFIMSILNYWMRLTFVEISIERNPIWYVIRLGGITFDYKDDSMGASDYNLFYFHSSPYLTQIDFLFFNLYTKFKK